MEGWFSNASSCASRRKRARRLDSCDSGGQHLERDVTEQRGVLGSPDFAHTAAGLDAVDGVEHRDVHHRERAEVTAAAGKRLQVPVGYHVRSGWRRHRNTQEDRKSMRRDRSPSKTRPTSS
jgi:hypothetical protein